MSAESSLVPFRSPIYRPKRIYHRRYLSQRRRRHIHHKRTRQRRKYPQQARVPSCSSSFIIAIDRYNQRQSSSNDLQREKLLSPCEHSASDHTIVARASKNSEACAELRTLLKHRSTSLEQLIECQLRLTQHGHYRSVSILIDDDKSLEHVRTSLLHCVHSTVLASLLAIFHDKSVRLTCMNFAFVNNALCDIVSQQRLRLIDTGRGDFVTALIRFP